MCTNIHFIRCHSLALDIEQCETILFVMMNMYNIGVQYYDTAPQ